jgi:hypothetical protein
LDRLLAKNTGLEDEQALRDDLTALAPAPENAAQESVPGTAA